MSSQPRSFRCPSWILNVLGGITLSLVTFHLLPLPQFHVPYSTLHYSQEGELVGATLADDQVLRFPPTEHVPTKFYTALLTHIDQDFHSHAGIEPRRLFKAMSSTHITYPQSCTPTQHVVRLARHKAPNTIRSHLIEWMLALKLEYAVTKEDILELYVHHVPFSPRIAGIEAASWHYFDRPSHELSWAEAATLAVLPHSHHRFDGILSTDLVEARNQVLESLRDQGTISPFVYGLAIGEPLVALYSTLNESPALVRPDA